LFKERDSLFGISPRRLFHFMANPITIVDAIKNRRLFGCLPRFKSLDTWTAWLVVLKAIFGLPMTAEGLAIFQRYPGRVSLYPWAVQKRPISLSVAVAANRLSLHWSPVLLPVSSISARLSQSARP
jgi:hypothetical protein